MFVIISFTLLSAFLYLFLFWRKLKDDYTQNQIFTTGFYSLLAIAVLSIIADNFAPLWWFWFSLAGSFVGVIIGIFRFRLRFFETLEAWVVGNITILFFVFLYNFLSTSRTDVGVGLLVIIALFLLFAFLDSHYKKFTWYKSGRIGFTGLSTLGTFFLVRAAVAIGFSDVLSFVGGGEVVLSAALAFISFITLFNLARREL